MTIIWWCPLWCHFKGIRSYPSRPWQFTKVDGVSPVKNRKKKKKKRKNGERCTVHFSTKYMLGDFRFQKPKSGIKLYRLWVSLKPPSIFSWGKPPAASGFKTPKSGKQWKSLRFVWKIFPWEVPWVIRLSFGCCLPIFIYLFTAVLWRVPSKLDGVVACRPSTAEPPPISKIHPFSKSVVTFEPVMRFGCPSSTNRAWQRR